MSNGYLNLTVNKISNVDGENGSPVIDIQNGEFVAQIKYIKGDYGIVAEAGIVNVKIQKAEITAVGIYSAGTGSGTTAFCEFDTFIGSGYTIIFYVNKGVLHGKVNEATALLTSSGVSEMYIDANKINVTSAAQSVIGCDGGTLHIKVKSLTTDGDIVANTNATLYLECDNAVSSMTTPPILICSTAVKTVLKGRYEVTTNNALIATAVGVVIADNAKFIVPSAHTESIGELGVNLISYNSFTNKAVNVNTDVDGTLTVGAYVV